MVDKFGVRAEFEENGEKINHYGAGEEHQTLEGAVI